MKYWIGLKRESVNKTMKGVLQDGKVDSQTAKIL